MRTQLAPVSLLSVMPMRPPPPRASRHPRRTSPVCWHSVVRFRLATRPVVAALAALVFGSLTLTALTGCSSPGTGGGHASGTSTAAAAANPPSVTGFDGALLPAHLRPREFTLTNQAGQRVSLNALRGRVVILAFLYAASKTTAPLIAQQIRGALDELESEPGGSGSVAALAVSVDPSADTPAHVRAFLAATSLTSRMQYLTGTPAQLRAVWRAYKAVPASAGPNAYERAAFVLLLDKAGAPRVEFSVEELTPEALAHDVRRLQSQ
jgi:cytochrome oxidase Cu insertion factor (SCO1/SenC/PrrC family)